MIQARVYLILDFRDADGVVYRDMTLPAVFPGLELKYIFGDDDDGLATVESACYDARTGTLEVWLDPGDDDDDPATFAELQARGWFARWQSDEIDLGIAHAGGSIRPSTANVAPLAGAAGNASAKENVRVDPA